MIRGPMVLALLCTIVAPGAHAQACLGVPGFGTSRARVGVSVDRGPESYAVGAHVATGRHQGPFIQGGVTRTFLEEIDDRPTVWSLTAGTTIRADDEGVMETCPLVGFRYQDGPDRPFGTSTLRESRQVFSLGVASGTAVWVRKGVELRPYVAGNGIWYRTILRVDAQTATQTDQYLLLGAGFGVVLRDWLGIRTGLTYPIGLDQADLVYGAAITANFWRAGGT